MKEKERSKRMERVKSAKRDITGRGKERIGDDNAGLGVRLGVGQVDVRGSGRGQLERAGRQGATERGGTGVDGAAADEGRGAAVGEGSRDVVGVG